MNDDRLKLLQMLKRTINRCETAYSEYTENKKYFQALRIKEANTVLYDLLQEYLFICDDTEKEEVINYIFHIEDWMNQFRALEKIIVDLDEVFVFHRLSGSPSYPTSFVEKIKKQ